MSSSSVAVADPAVEAALCTLEAGLAQLAGVRTDALSNPDRLVVLQRVETVARALPGLSLEWVAQLREQWSSNDFATHSVIDTLADGLRISPAEARARWRAADDLAPRTGLDGVVLDPVMPVTAAAQREGVIGGAHVKVLRDFVGHLPSCLDVVTRDQAEAELAGHARVLRPDQLRKVADRLDAILNPDGVFSPSDRERRRGFTMGRQGPDLMSKCSLVADPELRAYVEAVFAKYAKPGACNPEDAVRHVDGEPDPDAAERDFRSVGQRQHDAVKAVFRAMLASGQLGHHRGLPVSVVVSMSLRELEDAIDHVPTTTTDAGHVQTRTTDRDHVRTATADRDHAQTTTGDGDRAQTATADRDRAQTTTGDGDRAQTTTADRDHAQTTTGDGDRVQTATTHGDHVQTATADRDHTQTATTHADHVQTTTADRDHVQTATTHGDYAQTTMAGGGHVPAGPSDRELRAYGPPVVTGGGSLLPIHDAIRMAAHAHHYLALFDQTNGRPLYLGHTKRIATADQRIVLHAKDIGCTYPGCAKPGYLCQTHHRTDWAAGGTTDADQLTFACEPHHQLATSGKWVTTAAPHHHRTPGRTQWIPPTHIDPRRKPRINHYHHPSEYLTHHNDPDG